MKYLSIKMNWDSFTFPIAKGTPVSKSGILANNSEALGIITQTISVKPNVPDQKVLVGGNVNLSDLNYTLDNNALKAMDGISFYGSDGTRTPNVYVDGYTLPAATTSKLGGVKQAANVPAAVGEAPTKAEFDALLSALKTAGIMVADS